MALYIYVQNNRLRSLLDNQLNSHRWTDSGFDIPMLSEDVSDMQNERIPVLNYTIPLGIRVAAVDERTNETRPCLLLPRSSIGRTGFRLNNSIGLIDQGYRGEVQAKVDIVDIPRSWADGHRMFQICQHNFLPWSSIVIVDTEQQLPAAPDNRGSGGFGSTGY